MEKKLHIIILCRCANNRKTKYINLLRIFFEKYWGKPSTMKLDKKKKKIENEQYKQNVETHTIERNDELRNEMRFSHRLLDCRP